MNHEDHMRLAIESARTVASVPFGAVIVRPATGECLATGANRSSESPIIHGEIDAIMRCAATHPNVDWTDMALYPTAEPCPMCQSAIARAGTETTYCWGDDPAGLCENSNAAETRALEHYPGFAVNRCDDGFVRTSPLASFPPNPWGLHDIYGNVWEWVEDCWNTSYSGALTDGSAWLEGDCTRRGFRGGGYGDIPRFARSALRNRSEATARKDDIGFRHVVGDTGPVTRRR